MKKLTKKQKRLLKYNDIITRNKRLFKPGCVFYREELAAFFGILDIESEGDYKKIHRSNLKLVQLQTELNLLMREKGLYIQSSDYYSQFEIVNQTRTKSTVVRYSSEVDINSYCTTRLEAKLTERLQNNTWGKYNKIDKNTILNLGKNYYCYSPRHSATIERMKNY